MGWLGAATVWKSGFKGLCGLALLLTAALPESGYTDFEPGKEDQIQEPVITIQSTYDGTEQNMRVFEAAGKNRPLLIGLHTWSGDYKQKSGRTCFSMCRERDWHCVFPNYRGPNKSPDACGSEAAMQDIIDAVNWAKEHFDVDDQHIFLCGVSGGGHMALQMAGNYPSVWTAVSAWASITDLKKWHAETTAWGSMYAGHMELSCGGKPGDGPEVDAEYVKRSPVTMLSRAHDIAVDINAGIHDGCDVDAGNDVPVGHSIRAFNELLKGAGNDKEVISEESIELIQKNEKVPDSVISALSDDPTYSGRAIHLRKTSGLSRLTIFEGGHEIIHKAAFAWFEQF